MKKKTYILSVLAVIAIFAAILVFNSGQVSGETVTVYKSPSCGCCVGYISELRANGFEVNVVTTENMAEIKSKYNIPFEMQSCHTSVMGDYFVEGHMPINMLNRMLETQPEIDGIALPGMPAGSPGMPGYKNQEWTIYSLTNGEYSEFEKI